MTSQFSPKVSEVLAFSREEATRLASSYVGPEHLLLGMLREKESPVLDVFDRLSIDPQNVKDELEEKVRDDNFTEEIQTNELVLNTQASNILKLAVLEARIQHTQTVDVQHLLLAILHDQVDNGAKVVLENHNLNYETALQLLQRSRRPMDCACRTRKMSLNQEKVTTASRTGSKVRLLSLRRKAVVRLRCLTTSRPI